MKYALSVVCMLLLLAGMASSQTVTSIPSVMSFQGRLAKTDGSPLADGDYSITFTIYPAQTGGSATWTETINPVSVQGGLFSVLLGKTTPLTSAALNGTPYVEVRLGSDLPMSPRLTLASSAFAFKASTVPDASITGAQIAPGAITADKMAPGVLGGAGRELVVAQTGGQYTSVQAAINAAQSMGCSSENPVAIKIGPGLYRERPSVPAGLTGLSLIGDGAYSTIIRAPETPTANSVDATFTIGHGCQQISVTGIQFLQGFTETLFRLSDTTASSVNVIVTDCKFTWGVGCCIDGQGHEAQFMANDFDMNQFSGQQIQYVLHLNNGETAFAPGANVTCSTDAGERYKWSSSAKITIGSGGVAQGGTIASIALANPVSVAAYDTVCWLIRSDAQLAAGDLSVELRDASDALIGAAFAMPGLNSRNEWEYKWSYQGSVSGAVKTARIVAGPNGLPQGVNIWINDMKFMRKARRDDEAWIYDAHNTDMEATPLGSADTFVTFAGNVIRLRSYVNAANPAYAMPLTIGGIRVDNGGVVHLTGNRIHMTGKDRASMELIRCENGSAVVGSGNSLLLWAGYAGAQPEFRLLETLTSTSSVDWGDMPIHCEHFATTDMVHTIWQKAGNLQWRSGTVYHTADIPAAGASNSGLILWDDEAGALTYYSKSAGHWVTVGAQ